MNDEPIHMTATEIERRWTEWEARVNADPRARLGFAMLAAIRGDKNAHAAVLEMAELGAWANKYAIPALERIGGTPETCAYDGDDHCIVSAAIAAIPAQTDPTRS